MKKFLLIVSLYFITLLAFAGENKTCSVVGKVVDDATGEALVGARVVIVELNEEVYTDLDGNFILTGLNLNNRYTLKINSISYEELEVTQFIPNTNKSKELLLTLTESF